MPYKVRFRRSAKQEYEQCCRMYVNLQGTLDEYLENLAVEAEKKKHDSSIDWSDIAPEDINDLEELINNSDIAWIRFKECGLFDKIKACLTIVRQRRLPWELRCTDFIISFSETVPLEFLVVYELDHVKREMIVTLLDGPFTPQ